MVILWTDALIFLLLMMLALGWFYVRKKPHFKRPLQIIAQNNVGSISAIILLSFVLIGVLDSVHFRENTEQNEIISVLDYALTPLRTQNEKTYSAPFAITLYNKEMVALPNGAMQWTYPRLIFGGAHLENSEEKMFDIFKKTLRGIAQGIVIFSIIFITVRFRVIENQLTYLNFSCRHFSLIARTCFFIFISFSTLLYLAQFYHVLGTDKVGEDVFYQAIKGVRTGLIIGTLTTLIMLPMAIAFGILAGFFQGWVDDFIQYLYTTLNSIPSVLLIAASILVVQTYIANHENQFTSMVLRADSRLLFLCLILGMTSWTGLCRLLRAETLKLREMEYVQAAIALGVKKQIILMRHILPNVMHIVLISIVLDFSSLVLAEAVLSYINIGVDPTTYSWGNMINGARLEMAREPIVWWSLLSAFVFMFTLVLAANLFANCVQTAFNPRSLNEE